MLGETLSRFHPSDAGAVIFNKYQQVYQNDPQWHAVVEDAEQRIMAASKANLEVSIPLLLYMFGKPEIAVQFPSASLATLEAFAKAVEAQQASQVLETVFSIDEENGRVFATRGEQKPAAYDVPIPDIKTVDAPNRQIITMVHTHPPFSEVLKPSVYLIDEQGKELGDLFVFVFLHEQRKETMAKGNKPDSIAKPLSIIMQSDFGTNTEKMLFIMESDVLVSLDKNAYIKHLEAHKDSMEKVSNEEEVVAALREMGYKAGIVRITRDALYRKYPIIGEEMKQLSQELGLRS